jgi:hypothetical protein
MQAIGSKNSTCLDHTFQVVHNYTSSLGAGACYTIGTDYGLIASVGLVDSTSMSDAAHALEQCARRPNF